MQCFRPCLTVCFYWLRSVQFSNVCYKFGVERSRGQTRRRGEWYRSTVAWCQSAALLTSCYRSSFRQFLHGVAIPAAAKCSAATRHLCFIAAFSSSRPHAAAAAGKFFDLRPPRPAFCIITPLTRPASPLALVDCRRANTVARRRQVEASKIDQHRVHATLRCASI